MNDWNGKAITTSDVERSIKISYVTGGLGILWLVTATPQQILTVFVRNYLGATSTQLGLLVGVMNTMALLHLASIWFYAKLGSRKKTFFIATTLVQRSAAFLLAIASFSVAAGGSRQQGIVLVLVAGMVGALFGNSSGSGWWAWMADLVPESKRSSFFGKRSSISQLVNLTFFFLATYVVDLYLDRVFIVYGVLFSIGALAGIMDILLHILIPEPKVEDPQPISLNEFFRPLRDKEFRRFCLILGMYLFSFNLAAPFLAPYMTNPQGGGAPTVWLGITFVISQLTWVLMAPFWGMLMDRMGKKPVVIIGGLMVVSWIGHLFLQPTNYHIVLPIVSLVAGFFAPAFWEGISQFMISLSPDKHRATYSAWYWTAFGVSGAVSPLLGGVIYDFLDANPIRLGAMEPSAFQAVVVLSILMVLFSLTHMGRIVTKNDKSVRTVMSTILNPGVFRAVTNISILSRPTKASVVEKTLRGSTGGALNLGFQEICIRMDDPDPDVREAAIDALARLSTPEAIWELLQRFSDPDTLSRARIARALGQVHTSDLHLSFTLVQRLEEALGEENEEILIEVAGALSKLMARGVEGSRYRLLDQLKGSGSLRVKVSTAQAAARLGMEEAAEEIFSLMHGTDNWILRRQLAISLGDLFGEPGEIYAYMTGDYGKNLQAVDNLCTKIHKRLQKLYQRKAEVLKPIPRLYEQRNHLEAVTHIHQVWKNLNKDFPRTEQIILDFFWQTIEDYLGRGQEPQAQDTVLGLYTLDRLCNLLEHNRGIVTTKPKTI